MFLDIVLDNIKNGNEKIAYIEFDNLVPILIIELYL